VIVDRLPRGALATFVDLGLRFDSWSCNPRFSYLQSSSGPPGLSASGRANVTNVQGEPVVGNACMRARTVRRGRSSAALVTPAHVVGREPADLFRCCRRTRRADGKKFLIRSELSMGAYRTITVVANVPPNRGVR
jgi:hypothetical protein